MAVSVGAGCMLGPAPVCVFAGEGDGGDDGVLGVLSTVGGDGEGDCGVEVGVLVVDCGTEDGGVDGDVVGEVVGTGACVGDGTGVGGIRGGGDGEGPMGCLPRLVARFSRSLDCDAIFAAASSAWRCRSCSERLGWKLDTSPCMHPSQQQAWSPAASSLKVRHDGHSVHVPGQKRPVSVNGVTLSLFRCPISQGLGEVRSDCSSRFFLWQSAFLRTRSRCSSVVNAAFTLPSPKQ